MTYTYHYQSPLGGITLSSNGIELTGLWFDGQKYFGNTLPKEYEEKTLPRSQQFQGISMQLLHMNQRKEFF